MLARKSLVALVSGALAAPALAQTFQSPHFFVWSPNRPDSNIIDIQSNTQGLNAVRDLTCMVYVSVFGYWKPASLHAAP